MRSIGRWGVWVCTALVLISIPVSVWVEPFVYARPSSSGNGTTNAISVDLNSGSVTLFYAPQFAPQGPALIELRRHSGSSLGKWWSLPRVFAGGHVIFIPLIWPAVLFSSLSFYMWHRKRGSGIDSGCCECGDGGKGED
jgi:hypothetical protein